MPRIIDETLASVVYLYRSAHEAEEGINIGGSGFLISVPAERIPQPAGFGYAVTNKHVIEHGATVMRVNTADGRFDIFEMNRSNWLTAEHDDLAVCIVPGSAINTNRFWVRTVPFAMLLSREDVEKENVGPGDEIVLVGRFVNQEGKERNIPSVRFGHISQMPLEPIVYNGVEQESFLCEVKSIGGFSGSPVFLAPLTAFGRPEGSILLKEAKLLGVDWAHIQSFESAVDEHGNELPHVQIPVNTGMMAVVPAWKLKELLYHPALVRHRQMNEEAELKRRNGPKVALDSSGGKKVSSEENPQGREDFMRLVDVAARKRPQDDQT